MSGFWKDKRVLITGHTGFKGSWLSQFLIYLGAEVSGYSLAPKSKPNLFDALDISQQMRSQIGDVTDFSQLFSWMAEVQPDIVLHLAAQPLVRLSYKEPIETFATNIMGTVNVLEASRRIGCVRALVNVTTDKCYDNKEGGRRFRENDPLGGHDPYAASKACSELVTQSYRRSFFTPKEQGDGLMVASARAGNVLGGGDWSEDRIVPDVIRKIQSSEVVQIRNPDAVRPWQHVLDPLSGYLLLARKLFSREPVDQAWNFGPEDQSCQNVAWVTDYICKNYGGDVSWTIDKSDQPHESSLLRLDCSKTRRLLSWECKLDLQATLDWTLEWYKAFAASPDAIASLSVQQIKKFVEIDG
jgi:CDP-glucose 4,6-dehydratase